MIPCLVATVCIPRFYHSACSHYQEKYVGNQLAIVRGTGHLPDATLQRIAAEKDL